MGKAKGVTVAGGPVQLGVFGNNAAEDQKRPQSDRPNGLQELPRLTVEKQSHPAGVIARRAWELWQRDGCQENRALDHWLQAERELSTAAF